MPVEVTRAPLLMWERKGKSFSYRVTPEDRAWFVRALWREGKPAQAVGFTLLQRFATVFETYPTFTAFLRAYCQPINPAWFPGGKLSDAFVQRALKRGDKDAANKERDRAWKRVQFSSTPISEIPIRYHHLADLILSGKLSSPVPTATNFTMSFADVGDNESIAKQKGAEYATKRGLKLVSLAEGYRRGLNWFFAGQSDPPTIRFGVSAATQLAALALLLPWGLIWWWLKNKA